MSKEKAMTGTTFDVIVIGAGPGRPARFSPGGWPATATR